MPDVCRGLGASPFASAVVAVVLAAASGAVPAAQRVPVVHSEAMDVAWLFPLNPPTPAAVSAADGHAEGNGLVRLPDSAQAFTEAQLKDLFFAPDWHPEAHSPMPQIVIRGRAPEVSACGYCHLPDGQGRPENSALAGLPADYIVQQVADMKSGARHGPVHDGAPWPVDSMRLVAVNASSAEVRAAAEYFSAQTLRPRVTVLERSIIPRMVAAKWIYMMDPRGGSEPLGQRLIEWAPDMSRHEHRDDRMLYTAFVPPGSLERGSLLANVGKNGITPSCTSCHGAHLQGVGLVPAIAGRSPTYLLRQLVGFQTGARAGAAAAPMLPVASALDMDDMIAVAAFAAAH